MPVTTRDTNLCPHCKVEMEALAVNNEADGIPATQPGNAVRQFECPKCHHVEGRLHRG